MKHLLNISIILLLSLTIYIFIPPEKPLTPLSSTTTPISQSLTNHHFLILGFLPYWNLKKLTPQADKSLTHLAYFTLYLNDDGNIIKFDKPGEEEPGFTNYKRLLTQQQNHPLHSKLILTFMPHNQSALQSLLNNPQSRQQAIKTILKYTQKINAFGVNIDYEPLNPTPPSLQQNFTLFIHQLYSQLKRQSYLLTISIYPSSATNSKIWNLTQLSNYTDYFVVMTYDYHLPSGLKSGPNSPLRGAKTNFNHDIITNLAQLTKLIPPRKLLLGIPFYGYEWSTNSDLKYTPTQQPGSLASLARIQQLIDQQSLELLWDHTSLTPYAIRRENGKVISQIYYESIDSIKLKLELVKSAQLGGIAIWALGYEGDYPQLWDTINTLNNP